VAIVLAHMGNAGDSQIDWASLAALEHDHERVAGVVWVAGLVDASGYRFTRAGVRRVRVPALIVSARSDPYLADDSARRLFRWMLPPKTLLLLPSDLHGTDMLGPDAPPGVRQRLESAITTFVADQT
jgi:pimeloyl-ACP methyl ester carboxylesterase